jgi:ribosomal protein S18 acetylase RimI-like enzyme
MVSSVAVKSEFRGQGLAKKLMKGVVKMANERGIDRLNLAVFTQNLSARAVYESVGFTSMGDYLYFEK